MWVICVFILSEDKFNIGWVLQFTYHKKSLKKGNIVVKYNVHAVYTNVLKSVLKLYFVLMNYFYIEPNLLFILAA